VLCCGTRRSPASCSAKPSRWWYGTSVLSRSSSISSFVFSGAALQAAVSLFSVWPWRHKRRRITVVSCCIRESLGRSSTSVLIHEAGSSAAAIYCRNGGESSTSGAKAWYRSSLGSSKPSRREVIRSPRRLGGPWLWRVVTRGLPSCWPLLLGGDASRTPARGGGDALRLDCKVPFSFKVLFIKRVALYADRRFHRARFVKIASLLCTCNQPLPLCKKNKPRAPSFLHITHWPPVVSLRDPTSNSGAAVSHESLMQPFGDDIIYSTSMTDAVLIESSVDVSPYLNVFYF
jgi:hypothetical protein